MFWPLRKKKTLNDRINATKRIVVHGMVFEIKRISVLDHCTGAAVVAATYDTYQVGNQAMPDTATKKLKSYFSDVLMAGIVEPELTRKKDEKGKIFVDNLLTDWDLAAELHSEIMLFTYGKKKFKQYSSQGRS